MRKVLLACGAALGLSGCVTAGSGEGLSDYFVDVHNLSDRSVGVVVLRVRGGERDRSRFDLSPGGVYTHGFRQWDRSVAELRITLQEDKAVSNAAVVDLVPGKTNLDVTVEDGQVRVTDRAAVHRSEPWP